MTYNQTDEQYCNLLEQILTTGRNTDDRTGTGTIQMFGGKMVFDLKKGLPLLTTKKLHLNSIIHELLWFISGSTNIKYLQENKVTIWDEWADENGDLGPVYSKQWRNFGERKFTTHHNPEEPQEHVLSGKDQIKDLIELLKKDPESRRAIVSAWNPVDVPDMALPPCHCLFQFYTDVMTISEFMNNDFNKNKRDALNKTNSEEQDLLEAFEVIFDMESIALESTLKNVDPSEVLLSDEVMAIFEKYGFRVRRLSCQLYQRKLHCAF